MNPTTPLRASTGANMIAAATEHGTPFYYYDMGILRATLAEIVRHSSRLPMPTCVHYAIKANGHPRLLAEIASHGLGADVVSGGEITAALAAGFKPQSIVYSGVGKTDDEILLALEHGIGCFNVESEQELDIIDALAASRGVVAPVAIRVNPDIDAHTHRYITTGIAQSKFGIGIERLDDVVAQAQSLKHLHLRGLHFHIGSQITDMQPYRMLCDKVRELLDRYARRGVHFELINVGGGLGIDYSAPIEHPVPAFDEYFATFGELPLSASQELHFELGRAVVGQCGALVSRVTYVKHSRDKHFVIIDAGMNDLIRPALYEARHIIDNLSHPDAVADVEYEIVGPVCESSDVFAHRCMLPPTSRGDIIAVRSAGAYGQSMASTYNMRPLPQAIFG